MTKHLAAAAALALALVMAGCSASSTTPEAAITTTEATTNTSEATTTTAEATTTTTEDDSGVDWSDFAPTVRTRIEELVAAGDCAGLQQEFDNADANDNPSKADLMTYLDREMEAAGCY